MRNVTIDDRNLSLIAFNPPQCDGSGWIVNDRRGYSGSYTYCTTDEGPSAKISFTGVAVYYRSPAFQGEFMQFMLDGNRSGDISFSPSGGQTVNQTSSRIVWSQTNLENKEHTVEVFPGARSTYNSFIITEVDQASSPIMSISIPLTSATPASTLESLPQSTNNRIALGLSITFGTISFFIFLAITFFLFRRSRELNKRYDRSTPLPPLRVESPTSINNTHGYTQDSYHSPANSPRMGEVVLPMRPLPAVPHGSFTTVETHEYDFDDSARAWSSPVPSNSAMLRAPSLQEHGDHKGGVSPSTAFNSKLQPLRKSSVLDPSPVHDSER